MTDASILIIGASHEAALREAAARAGRCDLAFLNFWALHFAGLPFDRALADLADRAPARPAVVLAFGGNAHNRACLVESPEPFCTSDAEGRAVPEASEGRRFVPRALMKAHLAQESAVMLALAAQAHAAFPRGRFVHLASPPPVRAMPPVAEPESLPPEQREFLALLAEHPPPPALRVEAWRIQQEVFRDEARSRGADFLDPPGEALDEDGFLGPRYVAEADPSHANAAYGALALAQVAVWLRGPA